ncbi:UDP-3-O-(3-hydroxymyristoyl)glucosamine N-acyltransferase [Hyphobacterium marinum]|uniref:UDP-3-O-(3-hydroxymyristoyl)glucosamine N-acyltransferase n=1 Tax=Hyphobacterium marinum TaxID=3116574 RepID=A0ABU7M130_9PROT|nr:UDP-3-O-(3-hydroxymyristoyl)glucosamine N-acyltransferase [Hyphobacterium sp. Y6023]MEE2567529.1 UDP-3-O-(3-hydroxymyristoyl)glucosamine N-acyltransferase [Hyphobacterium sp. Y6023]
MADSRFYESLGPLTLAEIAAITDGQLAGDPGDLTVDAVEPVETCRAGALSYFSGDTAPGDGPPPAGAVFLAKESLAEAFASSGAHFIVVSDPRRAFGLAAPRIVAERVLFGDDRIDPTARIGDDCLIAPSATVSAGAVIGARTVIGPGVVVGPGVEIGENSDIGPHCVVRCTIAGARLVLQSGARIGESGFGVAVGSGRPVNVPHFGRVILGEDVFVGANSCIDRGLFTDTVVGDGCKFDNLVHVAHNVTIGEGSVFAGFSAISGSCNIGKNVLFGGRGGLADHVNVGDGAIIGANSATMKDVPAGEFWFGSPAVPKREYVRERMAIKRLIKTKTRDS